MSTLPTASRDAPRISSCRSCSKVISTVSLHKTMAFDWLCWVWSIFVSRLFFPNRFMKPYPLPVEYSSRDRQIQKLARENRQSFLLCQKHPNQRETLAGLYHGKPVNQNQHGHNEEFISPSQRCFWSFKHLQAHQWIFWSNNFCAYQFATPLCPSYTSFPNCCECSWDICNLLRRFGMAPWLLLSLDSCQRRRTNDRANFSSQKKKSSSCYVQPACSTQIYTKIMSNKIDIHKKKDFDSYAGKNFFNGKRGKRDSMLESIYTLENSCGTWVFTCFCQREIIFQPTHDFWASTCAAKKAQPYFPLYWLFDRDPYYGSQFL